MKRMIIINDILSGFDKRLLEGLLPELIGSFRQRKEFDEYYFDEIQIDLSLEKLDKLSQKFDIRLGQDELVIIE
jgi:hypothetical protein